MNISRIYRVYADGSIKPVDYLKSISAEDREKLYIYYMDKLLTHRKFIVFTLIFNPLENTKYQHPSKSPGESFDKTIPKNP